jgi:hypothetical protein
MSIKASSPRPFPPEEEREKTHGDSRATALNSMAAHRLSASVIKTEELRNSNIRRSVLTVIGVAALIVIMDIALGDSLGWLYRKTRTGESGGLINDALSRKAQVLLLGSSRMRHHAMPAVLNRKLSLTAFNAGLDGQDFLYAVMLFDLWQRSNAPPKAIVLNIDSDSFEKSEEELQRAEVFSFYYDDSPLVRQILNERSRFERLKFLSRAYRANGKVLAIAKNLFSHPAPDFDGFEPLSGHLPTNPSPPALSLSDGEREKAADWSSRVEGAQIPAEMVAAQRENIPTIADFWSLKVECFKQLADYCKKHGTRLLVVQSPRYPEDQRAHDAWVRVLSQFLADYPNVEFVDLSTCAHPDVFRGKAELFKDGSHLNDKGAEIFSTMLAEALQTKPHPDVPKAMPATELTARPHGPAMGKPGALR